MALVLGAVLGPDAVAVEVRDAATGGLRAAARARLADLGPPDDPATWWRALVTAIGRAGERHIAALSIAGDHPGLVLVDAAGVVLRPVRAWAVPRVDVERVREALGRERWARRAGLVPDATTTVTRLLWLRREDRSTYDAIGAVLQPHEWLTFRLTGRAVTDPGSASATGLWSPHSGRWIPDVLALLAPEGARDAWPAHLPAVLGAGARADWLDAPVFDQLGLRGRPLVAPGTGAPMALALALGLGRGGVAVGLGHRTLVVAPLDAPLVDPSGAVASGADATGHHLAVVAAPGGAALVEAVAGLLGRRVDELGRAALAAPGAGPLAVLPGVDGRPGAVVTGLGPGTTPEALARATFEGVARSALDALDALTGAGARWFEHEPIHLAGPAEGLEAHARLLAALGGRPVVATPGEPAAAGACVQAAAVYAGVPAAEVALGWGLGRGVRVEPDDRTGQPSAPASRSAARRPSS